MPPLGQSTNPHEEAATSGNTPHLAVQPPLKVHTSTLDPFSLLAEMTTMIIKSVAKRHSKTLEDLETFALEEFYAIPDEYVKKLFK